MMLSQESVAGESMANCGQWHLEREIGHGAYGVVFLAEGLDGERAAVKVCRRDAIGEERYERELRGAKLYRTIPSQEGLVRMREFVEESWGFYAVMDLADDEFGDRDFALDVYRPKTLADVIEGEKALPLDECVKLGMALAKGLATLQRHHLLHRDIKPGNVIYVGGRPVLSDPDCWSKNPRRHHSSERRDMFRPRISRMPQATFTVSALRSRPRVSVDVWRIWTRGPRSKPIPAQSSSLRGGASSTRRPPPFRPVATSPPRRSLRSCRHCASR